MLPVVLKDIDAYAVLKARDAFICGVLKDAYGVLKLGYHIKVLSLVLHGALI
jgi:hypothetical protein